MRGVVLALAMGVGAAAPLELPTAYSVKATMTMPYFGLVEPIMAYYDEAAGLGRLDYWEGVERYIYNANGVGYQIVPTTQEDGLHSVETCFTTGEGNEPISLLPDLTYFPDAPDATEGGCEIRGVACESYTLKSPTYNETTGFDGNYTLFVSKEDKTPLRFHFTGFNVILGSHYDEYVFDYIDFEAGSPDAAFFQAPAQMTCVELETDDGDDGGPTRALERPVPTSVNTPLKDIASMMPGGLSERAERFEAFASKHGKVFSSDHERFHRASLYHATEKYVNAMNRRRLSYWLEVNHLADLTKEERAKMRGRLHTPKGTVVPATGTHQVTTPVEDLPAEIDWVAKGAVTPPKDQGTCGSCWSYGATGTTEGQLFLKTGVLTPLSQQNLMDCSWPQGNHACDGGLDFRAYEWMLSAGQGGIAKETSYPYMNADGYCRFESSMVGATISGYHNITYDSVEEAVANLNDALYNVGPISVSIDATPDSFYYYAGGLYYNEECKSGMDDLDHTVLAVGYMTADDGQIYTKVKNSWSNHWGDEGFVYISQKDNCCGVATQPTYTILA